MQLTNTLEIKQISRADITTEGSYEFTSNTAVIMSKSHSKQRNEKKTLKTQLNEPLLTAAHRSTPEPRPSPSDSVQISDMWSRLADSLSLLTTFR